MSPQRLLILLYRISPLRRLGTPSGAIILILLFVHVFSSLNSQTFYRQYGNGAVNEGGQCVIASPDGNLFVGGYKNDSALIMKTDMAGNILWSRTLKAFPGNPNAVHQLDISPDNFLVGIANAFVTATGAYRDGYIFKMDLNGNLVWLNTINSAIPVKFESLHAYSTTSYIVFTEYYDVASASFPDPTSIIFDATTGNAISNTPRYDYIPANPYIDDLVATTISTNCSTIYSTGRIYVGGAATNSMRPHLTRYDRNGNLLAACYLSFNAAANARIYGSDLVYNNDSLAVAYFGDVAGSSTNFTIGLIRTDTNGVIAWSKNYNITTSNSEMCYKLLSHPGGYYITGFTQSGNNDFFILSVDLSGNVLWCNSFGNPMSTEAIRQYYTPNVVIIGGNIFLTGQTTTAGNSDIVLARIDLTGTISCFAPGTLPVTTTNNPTVTTPLTCAVIPLVLTYSAPVIVAQQQPINDLCSTTVLNLGNDTTLCSNYSLNATLPGATSYLWQDGSTMSTYSVTSPGTYWVDVQINCCTYTDTINIQAGSTPVAAFAWTASNCTYSVSFSNSSVSGTSYWWNFGDNTFDTTQSPVHAYNTGGSYSVTLITSNNCGSDTSVVTISLPVLPDLIASPAAVQLCMGDSTLLSASTTGGSGSLTYLWTPSSTTGSSVMISPTSSGVYYVTVTDSLGCTAIDSVSVTVTTTAVLNAAGGATICAGQSTSISANASNGGPYTWSNNLGSNPIVNVAPLATTTYYVTVFDSCSGSNLIDSVTVVVIPPAIVAFTIDSIAGCAPLNVHLADLSSTTQGQITGWLWHFGDGDSSTVMSPTHTYTTPGSYTITLTVTTSNGCVSTLVNGAIIDVYPVPVAGFSWNQTAATGDQPEVQFTDESLGANFWFWLFGDSTTSNGVDPFHAYAQSGNYLVTQVVGNSYGCYDTTSSLIELTGEFTIYVPNTFTPGSGNLNNTFGGIGTGIVEYQLMVFDRWGMLLFTSNDYNLQWDGTFKGRPVQEDTYVWVIDAKDFTGRSHHLIGHINVIR